MTARADVTLCIPAWQAGDFIDRTMRCAREQTHAALRIVVSVDLSDDATESICRSHARDDGRVEVHAQRERLGWAGNVNFLLDRADTEFASIYFHDDVIEPTYVERLVGALRERPGAASAHCDLARFAGRDRHAASRGFEGSATERLLAWFVTSPFGPQAHTMFRTELVGGARLPTASRAAVVADLSFLMRLVAAGPVLGVGEALYHKWDRKPDSVTSGWRSLPFEEVVEGYRATAEAALRIVDGLAPSPPDRASLLLGLFLFMIRRLRRAELRWHAPSVCAPERVLPEFAGVTLDGAQHGLPAALREQYRGAYDRVQRDTGRQALLVGDYAQAMVAFESLTRRHPTEPRPWARLAEAQRGAGSHEESRDAERMARRLRRGRAERASIDPPRA